MYPYSNGEWCPLWGLLFLPFLFWLIYLLRRSRDQINWRAAYATIVVFEFVLGGTEIVSASRGHWVYNEARIWGPRLFGVPIEEHLLYYFFSSLIVVAAFHCLRLHLDEKPG